MKETISKSEEFKEKIENVSKEFSYKLRDATCIGYSLFD